MIAEILADKTTKSKDKTTALSAQIASGHIGVEEIIEFCEKAKAPLKATCIESLEYATKADPELLGKKGFAFVVNQLESKSPRVKWESARVIGNTAAQHKSQLDAAIVGLLRNSEDEGTVVRWSSAYALGEIYKLKTKHQADLKSAFESIILREEKNSIRKIYQTAMKSK